MKFLNEIFATLKPKQKPPIATLYVGDVVTAPATVSLEDKHTFGNTARTGTLYTVVGVRKDRQVYLQELNRNVPLQKPFKRQMLSVVSRRHIKGEDGQLEFNPNQKEEINGFYEKI